MLAKLFLCDQIIIFFFSLQDKILQTSSNNETIQVTNDGATILKAIGIDNPAAKVLVGMCLIFKLKPKTDKTVKMQFLH